MIAFVVGVVLLYLVYRRVEDFIEDERSARITEKAAMRTLQVFWVCFCAFSIMAVMNLLYMPRFTREFWLDRRTQPVPLELMSLKTIGTSSWGFFSDDLPVCRVQVLLCQKIRGMGIR